MFEAGLKCVDCHSPQTGFVQRPNGETCAGCHDPNYAKLLNGWKEEFTTSLAQVDSLLHSAGELNFPDLDQVKKQVERIEKDHSLGVHNHAMIDGMLRSDRDWLTKFVNEHGLNVNRAMPAANP